MATAKKLPSGSWRCLVYSHTERIFDTKSGTWKDKRIYELHIAKLNGRLCGAKRPHSVSEQPNFYQSLQSNPYNDSSHPSGGE